MDNGFSQRATADSGSASPSIVEGLGQQAVANPPVRPNYASRRQETDSS
jgi:hypothetical protein